MTKRNFVVLSLLVLASLALAACGGAAEYECADPLGCVDIAPDESVHIAYMLTTTGATAFLGEDSVGGIELAIASRGGTLLGHEILLTGEDSGCSPEGGQTAATKVTSDPTILGVIGTNCSSAATAAVDTISEAGLVMISPSNTAPALTDPEGTWKPGYFRACHNDKFQGRVAAEFVYNELGARTAATVHDGSPYADQLQEVFADTFVELGGTITYQGAVNVGDTDMRTVLTSVAADSPDVLYFPIFEPEGPFIVAQSSEISGLENTVLFGADGLLVASFPENAGANANGMYLSGPFVSGATYDAFLVSWEAEYGGAPPSGFHAFAYDGTNIILDAVEKVAIQDEDGTLHIPRGALRDAMAATSGFAGLTGNLECNEYGDCATGEALAIFEITNAEIVDDAWPPQAIYTP
ncbi:MAG: branched-chain amino acid ABC transporter substrate-binding protein [Chloroflexi bacterium]|nr:branched-chain amino acid ABC transporter substrate-binding protein [Chloroflexota bacterium]